MSFAPHGSMQFSVQGQVLIAQIGGPWNVELVQAYQQAIQPYVQTLAAQGPWALVIDVHGEAICPPEALELIRQGAERQHKESRRACTSYVIRPEVPGAHLMAGMWRRLYAGILPFEAFATLDEALAWSQQQLAQGGA